MTALALMRMLGALALVLALLGGALWMVRRFDLRLPSRICRRSARTRRLEVVERLSVDPKRMLLLVRRDAAEHLVLMAPEGNLLIHAGDVQRVEAEPLGQGDPTTPTPPVYNEQLILVDASPSADAPSLWFDAERDGQFAVGSTHFLEQIAIVQRATMQRLNTGRMADQWLAGRASHG